MSDVLAGGDDVVRAPGRRRAVVGLLLALLMGGTADRWQVSRERAALLESVVAGERTVVASKTSIAALTEYSSRLLHSADVPAPARRSAYDNLAEQARRWRAPLEEVSDEVTATTVLPWHSENRAARRAYEQRLRAWIDLLGDFEAAPEDGLGDGAAPSRRAAHAALLAAGVDSRRVGELLG